MVIFKTRLFVKSCSMEKFLLICMYYGALSHKNILLTRKFIVISYTKIIVQKSKYHHFLTAM